MYSFTTEACFPWGLILSFGSVSRALSPNCLHNSKRQTGSWHTHTFTSFLKHVGPVLHCAVPSKLKLHSPHPFWGVAPRWAEAWGVTQEPYSYPSSQLPGSPGTGSRGLGIREGQCKTTPEHGSLKITGRNSNAFSMLWWEPKHQMFIKWHSDGDYFAQRAQKCMLSL